MQREFKNPKSKSIEYLKHIEQNRLGRYAYTPKQVPPRGAGEYFFRYEILFLFIRDWILFYLVPTFNDKAYPEVIPRFHLPKMPF